MTSRLQLTPKWSLSDKRLLSARRTAAFWRVETTRISGKPQVLQKQGVKTRGLGGPTGPRHTTPNPVTATEPIIGSLVRESIPLRQAAHVSSGQILKPYSNSRVKCWPGTNSLVEAKAICREQWPRIGGAGWRWGSLLEMDKARGQPAT